MGALVQDRANIYEFEPSPVSPDVLPHRPLPHCNDLHGVVVDRPHDAPAVHGGQRVLGRQHRDVGQVILENDRN